MPTEPTPTLLADMLPYMRHVLTADRELHEQAVNWSLIEVSASIGCADQFDIIGPTLTATRRGFDELRRRLVDALALENLGSLSDELLGAAQCTIDILVRNLYERTADVGFLATDAPLRDFCQMSIAEREQARAALLQRLQEYRAKYTVYDDLIVLAADGQVLLRLDDEGPQPERCTDPFVRRALDASGFVEHYGTTALARDGGAALLYVHRIQGSKGQAAGVLVLRFQFADEMRHIFAGMTGARDELSLVLLDENDRVLSSNDLAHVPIGATLRALPPNHVSLTTFAGREYLAVDCPARPYQAYGGPGWRARAMVSLLTAFRPDAVEYKTAARASQRAGTLHEIQSEVDTINRNLRRVVFNGRLMAGTATAAAGESAGSGGGEPINQASLKAVLHQVTLAGSRMRERVGSSIDDLFRTSMGRSSRQATELARLAAELMDRNLYERANDCRWWALSPVLRQGLADPSKHGAVEAMQQTLAEIHALYTVYRRLVVFDARGKVLASSLPEDGEALCGKPIESEWLNRCLALHESQRYAVSEFSATPWSDGEPSYAYLARIADPDSGQAVGGLAIVFDARRELRAMLADVLGARAGTAAYVDASGRIVASTDDALQPGGSSWPHPLAASLIEANGRLQAQGVSTGRGYREFKTSDGYDNRIRTVVSLDLGPIEQRRQALFDVPLVSARRGAGSRHQEIAIFQVGASRYALPRTALEQAAECHRLVCSPGGPAAMAGLVPLGDAGKPMLPVVCARNLFTVEGQPREGDGVILVLGAHHDDPRSRIGLRVDDLNGVLEIELTQIQPVPDGMRRDSPWLHALVRVATASETEPQVLVQLLDPQALQRLIAPIGQSRYATSPLQQATPALAD
jgi:chemotaxis signal transduction protein